MRTNQLKFILWTLTSALTAGSILLLGSAITSGVASPAQASGRFVPSSSSSDARSSSAKLPELAELQLLCQRDLRQPLYDAPPAPAVVAQPPPPPPPLPFKLAGTVIEPGHCRALLQTADGKFQFKRIGDSSDGAEILEIARDSITLRYYGHEQVLSLQKKESNNGS